MATLLIILLMVFFITGAPLFTIMLGATALGTLFSVLGFEVGFDGAINKLFGTSGRDEMEVLSTIPLFIYAGYLLAEAKTADRLVRFANAALGWMPGGLAVVTILTCALFTVFTGASGVTIIALGGVLMPALVRNGYPERFSLGLIAGTGSVGLLLPPALPLFIFGTVYGLNQSEEEKAAGVWDTIRFAQAGIVPGLFLIGLLCLVAIFVAVRKKLPTQKFEMGELGRSAIVALPELLIPFGVVACLLLGLFSLPEIAALTVVYVLILEVFVFKTIKLKTMWAISFEAMAMIGAIFMILLASTALTDFMVNAQVPQKMVAWTTENVESKIVFLLALNVILLIVGTVMDIFSAIVVVVPLIAPIAREYGIDPYHLGIIFLLNLEVGYLHPPVGLNLFLTSVKFQRPITEVMWATIPFLITMIIALFVITYVPQLTAMSVPNPKPTDPVKNLVAVVQNGVEESNVTVTELTLVDAGGNALKNAEGKPIVRKFADCRPKTVPKGPDGKPGKPPTDGQIRACQKPFFDVTDCKWTPKSTDPARTDCANKAIAKWAADWFVEHPEDAVFLVKQVALVDEAGDPITLEEDVVGKDGKPVLDKLGMPEKKAVPIVGPDQKAISHTLDWCDQLEFATDQKNCKQLFIGASACKISYEVDTDCLDEKCPESEAPASPPDSEKPAGTGSADGSAGSAAAAGSGSAVGSAAAAGSGSAATPAPADPKECRKAAFPACLEKPVAECIVKAAKSWVDDNQTLARTPTLKGTTKKQSAVEETKSAGCSTGDGSVLGVLFVGGALIVMRRRRRLAA